MQNLAVPFRQSIRFRLSLVIAAVILLAVMSVSAAGAFRDLRQAAASRAETLQAAASAYAAALSDPLGMRSRTAAFEHLRGMQNVRSIIYMAVEDADGNVFAQLGAGASIRGKTADLRKIEGFELLQADRGSMDMPIVNGGEEIGKLVLLADITDLREDLYTTLMWTLLAALGAIAGSLVVAQVLISRMTKPISELAAVMAEVGTKQDFSKRVPKARRRDEAGVLGDAFNGMIDNIHERDQRIAHHMETLEQTVEDRTRDFRLAKEEAENANAAKSDFLATMSHEIRTPMNGMMVMAEMLAAADLSVRHRRYAEIITRSGASLLTIINDILDLSKIEAGKLDLEAVPFSPERLVEDVASLFWEKARSKGLELAVHIAPDVPAQMVGDPTRLNQVITNLVNNALKFTEKGGVTIDIRSTAKGPDAELRISVTDTGVGIEASRIGAIFEAFSQADQSTTRRFGGTGLGLTVCRRLVDAMSGDIIVTSEVGKGSVFTVVIALPVEQLAPAKPDAGGLRIALAMAAPLLRASMAGALRSIGAQVREIDTPGQAHPGEIVLSPSEQLARRGGAAGAFNVCLTDVGDSHADALIRDKVAVDVLSLPLGRLALWEFVERALNNAFRGPAALASSAATAPTESFGHLAILAVDDNAVNREVLREALLSLGVEGDFVGNGVEAVEAASRRAYDVIFMDGSMPEMDGFTATRLIREAEAKTGQRRAFIAALTAQVRGADADAWAAAGADRHLTKPFTSARLMEALKAAGGPEGAVSEPAPTPLLALPPPKALAPLPAPVETAVNATQAPAAPPMIDEEAVATMMAVGQRNGRDVLGKVWKLFLIQGPDAAFKLETLAQAGDPGAIARQAHFLKSMALSAGASEVAAVCEAIENAGKAARLIEAVDLLAGLRDPLDAVCAEMKRRLEQRLVVTG